MTEPRRLARYAKLVTHDEAYTWMAKGWMPHRDLEGKYPCNGSREGVYAVLMVWVCDCEVKRPPKAEEQRQALMERERIVLVMGRSLRAQMSEEQRIAVDDQRDWIEERQDGWSV